jgi:hypothetical protein
MTFSSFLLSIEHTTAPELFVGWVVGVIFLGLFILVSFITDALDKRRK